MRRDWVSSIAVTSALAILLAACGASPSQQAAQGAGGDEDNGAQGTYERFAGMTGEERHQALVKAARKEGELVVYTSSSTTQETIAPAFEKKYGIDVEALWPGTSEDLRQRVLQEHRADQTRADVLESVAEDLQRVYSPYEMLAPYTSEIRAGLPEDAQFEDWTATFYYVFSMGWNTDLIAQGEQPTSYRDLADPKWKGKMGLVTGDFNWYVTLYNHLKSQGMSDKEFVSVFQRIAANARDTDGHSSSVSLLEAGDFALIPNQYQVLLLEGMKKGAPVSYTPLLEPAVLLPTGIAPMKDANNPAAALLFLDFYLSEGQQLVFDDFLMPADSDAVEGDVEWIPDDSQTMQVDTLGMRAEEITAWETAYENLLSGHGEILP